MSLPRFLVAPVLSLLKTKASEKINGNLEDIKPLEAISLIKNIPVLFAVA